MHEAEMKYASMPASDRAANTAGEATRPFANHDARRATATAMPVRGDTSLRALIDRLAKMADVHGNALHGIAGLLEDHADRVHGALPPQGEDNIRGQDAPYYGDGLLAQVWMMVDNLDQVLSSGGSRVAFHAGRNTTVA